jgi:TetR/AcrR family transcriptional regulator
MTKQKGKHATAEKILQAAQEVFIAKGFDGSSINDISDKAKINKSLIYHHFPNKIELWKTVKQNLLEKYVGKGTAQTDFRMDSFKDFLKHFVTLRFEFYEGNPDIVRLIAWQRLEKEEENIQGIQDNKFNSTVSQIKDFQQRGEVRPELHPEMVDYLIMTTASMAFMQQPIIFEGKNFKENKQKFLELII